MCDTELTGKDNAKKLQAINEYLAEVLAPKNFDPDDTGNAIINQEKNFEKICAALEELGVYNPGKLTVYKFYNKIEYFKNKPQARGKNKENN